MNFGYVNYGPEIEETQFDKHWDRYYGARYRLNKHLTFELRSDTYESAGNVNLIQLQEPARYSINATGYTGYVFYSVPYRKWNVNIGLGMGLHYFDLDLDFLTIDAHWHRWFKINTRELKLGLEYILSPNTALEAEIRVIRGDQIINSQALGASFTVEYDDLDNGEQPLLLPADNVQCHRRCQIHL